MRSPFIDAVIEQCGRPEIEIETDEAHGACWRDVTGHYFVLAGGGTWQIRRSKRYHDKDDAEQALRETVEKWRQLVADTIMHMPPLGDHLRPIFKN